MWYPARASHSAATTVRRWPAAVSRPAQSGVRCLRAGSARANKPALRLLRTAAARRNLTCAVSKEEGDNGPVQLATAALGPTVDTARLLGLLRGWANSFSSQSTNPLQLSLMVDSIQGGVRMTLIEVVDGRIVPLVFYDLEVMPEIEGGVFMAVRDGPHRQLTPPDEATIFQELNSFLRTAIPQCKRL